MTSTAVSHFLYSPASYELNPFRDCALSSVNTILVHDWLVLRKIKLIYMLVLDLARFGVRHLFQYFEHLRCFCWSPCFASSLNFFCLSTNFFCRIETLTFLHATLNCAVSYCDICRIRNCKGTHTQDNTIVGLQKPANKKTSLVLRVTNL